MLRLLERSWKGQASLAAAFWLVYIVFSTVIFLILSVIFSLFVPNFFTGEVFNQYAPSIKAIMLPYMLFSAVCVWRCAKNSWLLWNILARIIVVLAVIFGFINLFRVLGVM
jgi:hypothetical protein